MNEHAELLAPRTSALGASWTVREEPLAPRRPIDEPELLVDLFPSYHFDPEPSAVAG